MCEENNAAPAAGNWVNAADVDRLVRELDIALNGEDGAALQASLCDVVSQAKAEAAKLGRPLLAAPAAVAVRESFDADGFKEWVKRNLPDNTIIGSGEWWAHHLTLWALRFCTVAAAPQPPAAQGDARLWCVHVQGPDDVHAMPTKTEALERANELNECFGRHRHEEGDPIMRAVVIEWPHAADLHATALYMRAMADAARAAKEGGA